jgi:PIN domain nuclease of toxin-antitoxin system
VTSYILDASALAGFFEDRPGAEKVEELLSKATEGKRPLAISVVNWGEVYYSVWRIRGEDAANAMLREIARLPVELVEINEELAQLAASHVAEPRASAPQIVRGEFLSSRT